MKGTTVSDVAKIANVSISTVSRVINNNYPVSEATRIKVEKAIKELDFKPNIVARSMVKNKTFTVGVIVPSITNFFFNLLVKAIDDCLSKKGYTMFLCNSNGYNSIKYVDMLMGRQVDGIIFADGILNKEDLEVYKTISKKVPMIFINSYFDDINYISSNQDLGTVLAFDYLENLGHKNIAFIKSKENSPSYKLKEKIYLNRVKKHTIITFDKGNEFSTTKYSEESIVANINKILENKITAIFACNDLMAIGAIKGLEKVNLKVPEDISVVGFDNIYVSDVISPKLTTVDQHIEKIGELAGINICNLIDDSSQKINIMIKPTLVKKESCKANN